GRLRLDRRHLRQLRDGAGDRHHRPRGRLRAGVPAAPRGAAVRQPVVAQENQGRIAVRPCPTARRAAARRAWPATPARADRRDLRAVRELHPPVSLGVNPSADALRATFGGAIARAAESCGDTIVYVDRAALLAVMAWLRDTPGQQYDYLVDVTAVEYRDRERPLEVVYNLRSLARRTDLRVKVELDLRGDLAIDSVVPVWRRRTTSSRPTCGSDCVAASATRSRTPNEQADHRRRARDPGAGPAGPPGAHPARGGSGPAGAVRGARRRRAHADQHRAATPGDA